MKRLPIVCGESHSFCRTFLHQFTEMSAPTIIHVSSMVHLWPPPQSAREETRLFERNWTKIDENRQIPLFHSPHHEIRSDRTRIFHGSFESCVLTRLVKEKRGVLNLFREISIETGVIFCVLHATSSPVIVRRKPLRPTFSSVCNMNAGPSEHVPPLPTVYRRGVVSHRRVSLNYTHI